MRSVLPCIALAAALTSTGCATQRPVDVWTTQECHRATVPFERYAVELAEVPGFKQPVMRDALEVALQRRGLLPATPAEADIVVRLTIALRRPDAIVDPPGDWSEEDDSAPVAGPSNRAQDPIAPSAVGDPASRFLAQATIRVRERATNEEIWAGTLARSHSISGAEPFHSERATLLIATALDQLLVALDTRCGS